MTQEEKELLIKDLSARLPYKVKASYYGTDEEMECIDIIEGIIIDNNDAEIIIGQYGLSTEKVKPYLFPLSSMTEEQRMELNSLLPVGVSLQINSNNFTYFEINVDLACCFHIEFRDKLSDWFNKNHFDYRGLIEKGLALDATKLNIY